MKKFYRVLSGLLTIAITLFEIKETKRFISLIAEGNTGYMGELAAKGLYILALCAAGLLLMTGKKKKACALCLTAAGGVTLYKAFTYVVGIIGNEMILGIVLGNVIDITEIVLFAAPAAIALLSGERTTKKAFRGCFIATAAAFIVGIAGRIITFVSWGKSFASDFALLLQVYGIDMLRTIVMLGAFSLALLSMVPEKTKKHR